MAEAYESKILTLKLTDKELDDLNEYLDTDGLIEDGDYIETTQFEKSDFEDLFNLDLDEFDIIYDEIDSIVIVSIDSE